LYTELKQDVFIINKSATLELVNQAMDGDKSAIYQVGMNYYHASDGFPCRQYIGCQWIRLAAKLGIDDAQLFIGEIYKQQGPFEQNYFKASLWFNRAKQNKAKFQLGLLYEMGLGVLYSHNKAYKLLTKNVDDDNLFRLGLFYFYNRYRDTVSVFETCVKRGNIEAVDRLRCMYLNGYDHKKDPQMALKLLEYAADRGHTRSQVALARLYTRREFAHRDPAKSVKYYFLAAKGGDPHAQYQIAMRYLSGEYVGRNYAKAFELIQAPASQGYTLANRILTVPANINQYIMEPAILNMFLYVMEHNLGHVEYNIGCIYEERGRWRLGTVSARLNITSAIHWFTLSANQNNADAQYRLGLLFEEGKARETDLPRASSYYRMAIASGHCEATLALACMYIDGRGVDQDFITAYHLFSDAANMGHKEAKNIINLKCYRTKAEYTMYHSHNNATVKISDTLNMQMIEAVGSQNHAVQYQLGKLFEFREPTRALLWYEKAGKGGIHDAYFCLGVMYEQGVGDVTQDFLKAVQMYRLCVNHAHAIYRLGQMYQFGRGVKQDYTQAYHLYQKAVDIGDDLRFKILNRKKKDNIELKSRFKYYPSEKLQDSISMWEYLAQQGDTQAQYELAYAYHLGFEEPRFPECIKWYSMASAHPDAIRTLGYFHEKGLGGFAQDTQKAIRQYEKARKLGNVESVFRLGEVYYNGTGIEQDCLKGLLLYIEAARDGSIDARNRMCYLYSNGGISPENKACQDIHCQSTYDAYRDYVF
jgi:TPR repeat protein